MAADKMESIGALWLKDSKAGNKFMSGMLNVDGKDVKILVFKNKYKNADNHPDYRIFLQEDRGAYDQGPRSQQTYAPPKNDKYSGSEVDFDDDVPF